MTSDRVRKSKIRARMAITGERFTVAQLTSSRQGPRHRRTRHGEGIAGLQIAFAPTRGETPGTQESPLTDRC